MLFLHTSNQLEQLTEQYSKVIDQPLTDVFTPELVIVQNAGMGRYLSLQVADKIGINANTNYLFPAEFTWEMLRSVLPDISEQDPSAPLVLRWRILEVLLSDAKLEKKEDKEFPEIEHYLTSTESIWDLSVELASALDKILFYRDEWVRDWENKDNQKLLEENWQARLWNKIFTDKQSENWLSLQDQFVEAIKKPENKHKLPERVSFFSLSALSPGYIRLLGEIGQLIEIHLFIINPSQEYWEDIESEKYISKKTLEEQPYFDVGNALLSSMGRQCRDFIWQFEDLDHIEKYNLTLENETSPSTLLTQIQYDVLNLYKSEPLEQFVLNDSSIQFHSCHTVMREVEVLHDQILACLENDTDLSPSDIIVMMPDIDKYSPYIETIFSAKSEAYPQLPFSIADQNPTLAQPTIEAFLKILDLTDKRFDVESVFELLDYDSIRERFNLKEDDVLFCRDLARSTNIRWGISAKSRSKTGLPNTDENTWRYALNRMLLGYTLSGDDLFTPQGAELTSSLPLLPFTNIEGSQAITVSYLIKFTDALFKLESFTHKEQSIQNWITDLNQFIRSIFSDDTHNEVLFKSLDKLHQQTDLSEFGQNNKTIIKLPFSMVVKIIKQALQEISGNEKFLGYGITFCALVPMRSVPFKVIALLGMNDGEYPRQDRKLSFDEVAKSPQKGDRSTRNEDRYLFLESILAARQKLIVSYIGQSIKDNTQLPPSVLVSELIDELCIYTNTEKDDWICNHPLQAFSTRYFDRSDDKLFSYNTEYIDVYSTKEKPSSRFITSPLETLTDDYKAIHLEDFITFFQSPAKTFLKERFTISNFDKDLVLPTRESFDIESFKDRDIRQLILAEYQNHEGNESYLQSSLSKVRANGLLPYGEIGDSLFNKEASTVESFVKSLPEIEFVDAVPFNLDFDKGFILYGHINSLTENGIVSKTIGDAYAGDFIRIWLTHLVLNTQSYSDEKSETSFYSPKETFKLKSVSNAKEILSELISYYWSGLHYPLHFYPKPAYKQYSAKKSDSGTNEALKAWNNDRFGTSEGNKFENWLLFRDQSESDLFDDEYEHITQLIFKELYECYEPI